MTRFVAVAIFVVAGLFSLPINAQSRFCDKAGNIGGLIDSVEDLNDVSSTFWGSGLSAKGRFDDDKYFDFCRVIYKRENSVPARGRLACTKGVGTNFGDEYKGKTYCSPEVDLRAPQRSVAAWTDFDGDGKLDYCTDIRKIKDGQQRSYIKCYLARNDSFKETDEHPVVFGRGLMKWVDFDGDGKTDFCEQANTDDNGEISCIISDGEKFSSNIIKYDLGYWVNSEVRDFVDINADGKTDFCSIKINKFLICHLSNGSSFSDIKHELISVGRQP